MKKLLETLYILTPESGCGCRAACTAEISAASRD